MSLMSAFYTATSGMSTSQYSLNTTAHNLGNINTTGYTRQQVLQSDFLYNTLSISLNSVSNRQVGLGTVYSATRQVRDVFLDESYRRESGRSAFYEVSYQTMEEVETLLGEMEGATFSAALNNLWEAVQELYKEPSSSVSQNLLVQRANQFIETSDTVYKGLCRYQDNLNTKVKQKVEQINDYAKQIYQLNHDIVRIEASGLERANDMRDARNQLLDELGELANIDYSYDFDGNAIVRMEGTVLVNEVYVDEIGLEQDNVTGFYTPYWTREAQYERNVLTGERELTSIEGAKVFDYYQELSTYAQTDIGSLKATYFARGDRRANYTDIDGKYEMDVSQSILMNVQAEYDQLIHSVVDAVNSALYKAANTEKGYLCGSDGKPLELFQRLAIDSYDSQGKYIEENAAKEETLFNCCNLKVNEELLQTPSKLGFVLEDGKTDYETAQALLDAFEKNTYQLNIEVQSTGNFTQYYSHLVSQIANSGSIFKGVLENQETTVNAIEDARDQIIGVSSDEELSNMIRYQNAYNANSRYFNVINEMLEHLLSSL